MWHHSELFGIPKCVERKVLYQPEGQPTWKNCYTPTSDVGVGPTHVHESNLKLQSLPLEIFSKKKCNEDVELVEEAHLATANVLSENCKIYLDFYAWYSDFWEYGSNGNLSCSNKTKIWGEMEKSWETHAYCLRLGWISSCCQHSPELTWIMSMKLG